MARIFKHYVSRLVSTLLLIEGGAWMAGVYTAHWILVLRIGMQALPPSELITTATFVALISALSMAAFGLYHVHTGLSTASTMGRLLAAAVAAFAINRSLLSLHHSLTFDARMIGLGISIGSILILVLRTSIFNALRLSLLQSRVLIVGQGALAHKCSTIVAERILPLKYRIVGFVPLPSEERAVPAARILSSDEPLFAMAQRLGVREIVVAAQNRRAREFPLEQLLECKLYGIKVTEASAFIERETRQIRVDSLYPSLLIYGDGFDQSAWRTLVKRTFDLLVSSMLLILLLPVILITALCVYVDDRGAVVYRQERISKNGKVFFVLKFRSMRANAEAGGTPQWAVASDSRVTRVGRFIRATRIDELPQVLNVLKGDMSFVGPRPERPYFVRQLSETIPYYDVRHTVKPGITGFAQVRYKYGSSIEDSLQKLQYDLYYVKNNGLFLDMLILVETLHVVLFAKGSK